MTVSRVRVRDARFQYRARDARLRECTSLWSCTSDTRHLQWEWDKREIVPSTLVTPSISTGRPVVTLRLRMSCGSRLVVHGRGLRTRTDARCGADGSARALLESSKTEFLINSKLLFIQ